MYQVSVNAAKQLQIISRVLIRRLIYTPDEYPALRELFTQIVAKHAEQIVLKRSVGEKK